MSAQTLILNRLLSLLKQRLINLQLWNQPQPSAEAFASSAPFCVDTMSLEQWLRYVFLPRMQALLDAQASLPTSCAITEQVEVLLQHPKKQQVMEITLALDNYLTKRQPPPAALLKQV